MKILHKIVWAFVVLFTVAPSAYARFDDVVVTIRQTELGIMLTMLLQIIGSYIGSIMCLPNQVCR